MKPLTTLSANTENNINHNQEINNTERELNELYDIKARGAQIRSRIEYLEKGEKYTFLFGFRKVTTST